MSVTYGAQASGVMTAKDCSRPASTRQCGLAASACFRACPRQKLNTYRRLCMAVRAAASQDRRRPDALLFDCDGVLVDTEPDGHRVAFNEAFKQKGINHEWDLELYGRLLETGGGKERMTVYFTERENEDPFKSMTESQQGQELVKELHLLKTDLFMRMVEDGMMPLRPGVKRLVDEAIQAGVPVAVCSTSNERAVSTIVRVLLGPEVEAKMRIFAGDIVKKKKPSPDIYNLAASELKVDPARCVVIEDSVIGLQAAKAAGMRCIVTKSRYTENESFDSADAIVDCIGEAGDERFSLDDLLSPGAIWERR